MFTIELIDKFYPSAYRELQAKIADQGLEIVSLSELADVDWEKMILPKPASRS